jgi:NAD(P)H-hydrate epimerase
VRFDKTFTQEKKKRMPKIVTTEQMRAIEKAANAKKQTYAKMMEMAGRAVAERVKRLLIGVPEPRIAILVGPSNNGGDGLVAGRILAQELENATVGAFLLKLREDTDEVFSAARDAGIFIADAENDKAQGYRVLQNLIANADVVIDALFGTGVHLPLEGDAVKVLQATNKALILRKAERPSPAYSTPTDPIDPDRAGPIIVAVDCPSGLNCDTGELDKHAIPAHETITFGAAKPGLFRFPGADAVGRLHIGDIGLPERLAEVDEVKTILVDAAEVGSRLPHRSINSHKGTYGKTMIVAGSLNYIGAAYLAASAAYRVGTGLVTIGAPQIIVPILAGMIPRSDLDFAAA